MPSRLGFSLAVVSLMAAAAAACASSAGDVGAAESAQVGADAQGSRVTPNDVTYLFPYMPGSREDLDQLMSADERAGDAPIWPDALWDPNRDGSIIWAAQHLDTIRGAFERPMSSSLSAHRFVDFRDGALDRHEWKITSFRFDPCAAVPAGSADACAVELRLVLQPVARDGDLAAHFIYRFERDGHPDLDARDAMIGDLVKLAKETRRVAPGASEELAVHPGLVSSERRAFADQVRAFLLSHLRRDKLAEVAFFGEIWRDQFKSQGGSSDIWEFFKGRVNGDRFELVSIPTLSAAPDKDPQRSQMVNVRLGFVTPYGQAIDKARVATGEIGTVQDTDCAGCHHVGTDSPGRMVKNLRMLGPFQGEMTIKPRVVAETAKVVDEVNRILAAPKPGG